MTETAATVEAAAETAADRAANTADAMSTDLLARTRLAVDPVLRDAVDSLPESMRRIAAYHFGWLNADGLPTRRSSGKALRPALVLAAARSLGGRARDALPGAAAVELVHNFTLLHDDVIDRDPIRRHRPTAWAVFGAENAILAGDAMHSLAYVLLARDRHPAASQAAGRLADCVIELCDGQHADCAFERRDGVTLAECVAMAEHKTGALLGCACALGALYAGADDRAVHAMDGFGRELGLAFQLVDDLLGIWGDPEVTGKPVGADLAARKKSLPVVAALHSETPAADELAKLYATSRPFTDAELRRAAEAVDLAGGREWARASAEQHIAAARRHLAEAVSDSAAAADLVAMAELITRRNH